MATRGHFRIPRGVIPLVLGLILLAPFVYKPHATDNATFVIPLAAGIALLVRGLSTLGTERSRVEAKARSEAGDTVPLTAVLARCPNCSRPVHPTADECPHCSANFAAEGGWRPVPQTEEASKLVPPSVDVADSVSRLKPWAIALILVPVFLYLRSMFLPGLLFASRPSVTGADVLLSGWLGIISGQLAWYGNPLLLIAVVQYLKGRAVPSFIWSASALMLAATAPFATEWWFSEAAGTKIVGLGSGYWLWLASIGSQVALSAVILYVPQATSVKGNAA